MEHTRHIHGQKKVCEEERDMKHNDRASMIQIMLFTGKSLELILNVFKALEGLSVSIT